MSETKEDPKSNFDKEKLLKIWNRLNARRKEKAILRKLQEERDNKNGQEKR